jgi:hypothetical protein
MLKIVKAFAEKFGYIIFLCGLNPKASPTRWTLATKFGKFEPKERVLDIAKDCGRDN